MGGGGGVKTPEQVAAQVRGMMAYAIAADRKERDTPSWAIVQGGLIQDSSVEVECIDLDWLDQGETDIDEAEGCWKLLARINRPGWAGELAAVRERLQGAYDAEGYDQEMRVWNVQKSD